MTDDGTGSRRPLRTTAEWQAADAHWLHPFTDTRALARKGVRIIERAEGVYLHDSDGRRILDAMSGLWCVDVGYGRRELVDAAVRQMARLPYYNGFFQTATEPAIELAERLVALTPPQFRHVFFAGSGSEASDTVVRMARRYWDLRGQPGRDIVIGRWGGYHGSTMCGASLGGMPDIHAQGGLPIPGIEHIDAPSWWEHRQRCRAAGTSPAPDREAFGRTAAGWLEKRILELGPGRVAAFIGEPVQGAGGVIVPPESYWPEIERICRRHDVLLIADEVICGFGRTGRWFGCERFAFEPDLMMFAKGVTSGYVPLGGVMVGERVADVMIRQGGEFAHGYTYSGHPVACAVALANLRLIEDERLVERVRDDAGPGLARRFEALAAHPLVAEAETCGLMGALQLVRDKAGGEEFGPRQDVGTICRDHCLEQGVVMRAVGSRMIVAPPFVISPAELDEMCALIRRCLDLTLVDVERRGWV